MSASVNDSCRLCNVNVNVRIHGTLSGCHQIFTKSGKKSVKESLIGLGIKLSDTNLLSNHICQRCMRLIKRIESDLETLKERKDAEKENVPVPVVSSSNILSGEQTPSMKRVREPQTPSPLHARAPKKVRPEKDRTSDAQVCWR